MEGRPGKARACFFIDYCDDGAGRTEGEHEQVKRDEIAASA